MALNDDSIMSFGKHKDKKLSEVPNLWWEKAYRAGILSGDYKAYAEETVPILRWEKEKANRTQDRQKNH